MWVGSISPARADRCDISAINRQNLYLKGKEQTRIVNMHKCVKYALPQSDSPLRCRWAISSVSARPQPCSKAAPPRWRTRETEIATSPRLHTNQINVKAMLSLISPILHPQVSPTPPWTHSWFSQSVCLPQWWARESRQASIALIVELSYGAYTALNPCSNKHASDPPTSSHKHQVDATAPSGSSRCNNNICDRTSMQYFTLHPTPSIPKPLGS